MTGVVIQRDWEVNQSPNLDEKGVQLLRSKKAELGRQNIF